MSINESVTLIPMIYIIRAGLVYSVELPYITQDGRDGDEETGFVANILDNCGFGFKYFYCKGITTVKIKIRGYCRGAFSLD